MLFELCLEPDSAVRLTRLPSVARGRSRPQRQRTIWYDSPDRRLAEAGLALSEEKGSWRLERLCPGLEDWPPACPAPVLAEAPDASLLGIGLPANLAPAAACEGHVSEQVLETEHGPVTLKRLRGLIRTVATERPVARVSLSGEEGAVLAAARAVGDAAQAWVPRASLAAEAFAAADSTPPAARRLGAPTLPGNGSICEGFSHALGHLTDVILHHAPRAAAPDSPPEPIHQMRVAVRRLRSTITVFRDVFPAEPMSLAASSLRALAQALGPAREWDVFMTETAPAVSAVLPDDARLARLLNAARRKREEAHATLGAYLESPEFRRLGIELAWLAGARSWHSNSLPYTDAPANPPVLAQPLSAFAAASLQRRLKKLRTAGENIEELDIPALHGLRLRAKRMRYAAEIMAPLFPPKPTRRFIDRLSLLQARLGFLNDGAVAASLMEQLGGPGGRHGYAVGLVLGFTAAGTSSMRSRIVQAWEKFLRQPPFWA
jgi:CHAD domain-containing protein